MGVLKFEPDFPVDLIEQLLGSGQDDCCIALVVEPAKNQSNRQDQTDKQRRNVDMQGVTFLFSVAGHSSYSRELAVIRLPDRGVDIFHSTSIEFHGAGNKVQFTPGLFIT